MSNPMPLEGVRVVELAYFIQGPVATQLLSQFGAEVIKIEDLQGGDPARGIQAWDRVSLQLENNRNILVEHNNANKKSITINLKEEKGRQLLVDLIKESDVFLCGFRREAVEKLGLTYESLSKENPKLIYVSASGYGEKGPDAGLASVDLLLQARSGIMNAIGPPGLPPITTTTGIVDMASAIMAAYGTLMAIIARERYGVGQKVDVSQLSSMILLQSLNVTTSIQAGKEFERIDRKRAHNPLWNYYECKDGNWIAIGIVQSDRYWDVFCDSVGISDLKDDAMFLNMQKRLENCEVLISKLDLVFRQKDLSEWIQIMRDNDLPHAPVQRVSDLQYDPQVIANEYIKEWDHLEIGALKILGPAVKLSETPGGMNRAPAPQVGQHTEELLLDLLGFDWDKIISLKENNVI